MTNGDETSPVRVDTDGDGLTDDVEAPSPFRGEARGLLPAEHSRS